jgi:hypothetical protein
MGLTDTEVAMLAQWATGPAGEVLELRKLWMYDNHVGDAGALAAAGMLHAGMLELHLSHNFITDVGELLLLGVLVVLMGIGMGMLLVAVGTVATDFCCQHHMPCSTTTTCHPATTLHAPPYTQLNPHPTPSCNPCRRSGSDQGLPHNPPRHQAPTVGPPGVQLAAP